MLREDEIFSTKVICQNYSASYRIGEDPPDIYISINKEEIAIEISTLTEHVFSDSGDRVSRLSQDSGVISLCDELDHELNRIIPNNIFIILTIPSPIKKIRKFKSQLIETIISTIRKLDHGFVETHMIRGVKVRINVINGQRLSGKKIVGIIPNELSSPDILRNATLDLKHRIEDKTKKCGKIHHKPLWLALFNDYWLADFNTYQRAFETLSINHVFDKILIIDGSKNIYEINQM